MEKSRGLGEFPEPRVPLPARIFYGFMEKREPIKILPLEAFLIITCRCNLSCPFCFQRNWAKDHRELPVEKWLSLIDELAAMQVTTVTISGGEPKVSPALLPMIERIKQYKMRFRLITNGTLINRDTAEAIASGNRCDYVQISLDGFAGQSDRVRGEGCFEKSTAGLKMLAEAGVKLRVNTVLSQLNREVIIEFAEFLETLPISLYRINPLRRNAPDGMGMSLKELAELALKMNDRRGDFPKMWHQGFPFGMIDDMSKSYDNESQTGECLMSYTKIVVQPDGAVVPCSGLPEAVAGYASERPLSEIWRSEPLEEFRAKTRFDTPLPYPEICPTCRWRCRCLKYCPRAEENKFCYRDFHHELLKLGWKP